MKTLNNIHQFANIACPSPDGANGMEKVYSDVLQLPLESRTLLVAKLVTDWSLLLPVDTKASVDPILSFIREVRQIAVQTKTCTSSPSSNTARSVAEKMLSLQQGLTGAERAFVAAILLYHSGKPHFTARMINAENDRAHSSIIANISTSIAYNIKSGMLGKVKSEEESGHSEYYITPQGFSFFEFLQERLKDNLRCHAHERNAA